MKIKIQIDFPQEKRDEAHKLAEEFESKLGKPRFKLVKLNEILLRWD
jgi:hypothetical protein